MKYNLDFLTSYNQFYIIDGVLGGDTGSINFWTDEAFKDKLAIEKGVLGIGIESYGHVKAELHILDKQNPETDFSNYDHIVEAGITISTGLLQITNCPDNEVELSVVVDTGNYRTRVYSINLTSVDIDEEDGDDFYKIEIWPDNTIGRKVLKRYSRSS